MRLRLHECQSITAGPKTYFIQLCRRKVLGVLMCFVCCSWEVSSGQILGLSTPLAPPTTTRWLLVLVALVCCDMSGGKASLQLRRSRRNCWRLINTYYYFNLNMCISNVYIYVYDDKGWFEFFFRGTGHLRWEKIHSPNFRGTLGEYQAGPWFSGPLSSTVWIHCEAAKFRFGVFASCLCPCSPLSYQTFQVPRIEVLTYISCM